MMYGTGADTLRCLALATVDDPIPTEKMNLQDPATFCEYEVRVQSEFLKRFLACTKLAQFKLEMSQYVIIEPYNLDSLCVIVL